MTLAELVELMWEDGIKVTADDIHDIRFLMETEPEHYRSVRPKGTIYRENEGIDVTMVHWPVYHMTYRAIFNMVTATWGPHPLKEVDWPIVKWIVENQVLNHATLSQALEIPVFVFAVTGAPRSAMDQHFRPRIGAGFAAQGVRDNDARQRPVVLPRELVDHPERAEVAAAAVHQAMVAYADLVDLGASYQGARAVLPMGVVNNWMAVYNWLSLSNMMGKRLMLCEQPETVEVAWLMWSQIDLHWSPRWALHLLPNCVRAGRCLYSQSYVDGQLFSDLHNPVACPIYRLHHPDIDNTSSPTFQSELPLALESWREDRKLFHIIDEVIHRRKCGATWFDIFREVM